MSYMGRVEIRAVKEGDDIEILEIKTMPQRGVKHDLLIVECGPDDIVRDALKGRTDGVHDIAGTYHEHYSQDYWGEWDADFWLENERVRFRGPLKEIA